MYPVIEWKDGVVVMLDQRRLPLAETFIEHHHYLEVARSIREMAIRGAPAIGVAAAMGIALGMANLEKQVDGKKLADAAFIRDRFDAICQALLQTRPTAVNLHWAVERMKKIFTAYASDYPRLRQRLIEEALAIDRQDVEINRRIGANGQVLLQSGQSVLTHCNAGALATSGYGTALGVIRAAVANHKKISVIAGETRPYLQGARLTVWELQKDHIPVTLITDSMAGDVMRRGLAQVVLVGADRIAANGDTANKIGTYSLAVLASFHHIPFYVAAPLSTIDSSMGSGRDIPIEERDQREVTHFSGQPIAPPGTAVFNPAFDITPAELISAIITEKKILYPDYPLAIRTLSAEREAG